jgi:hypothetical protein
LYVSEFELLKTEYFGAFESGLVACCTSQDTESYNRDVILIACAFGSERAQGARIVECEVHFLDDPAWGERRFMSFVVIASFMIAFAGYGPLTWMVGDRQLRGSSRVVEMAGIHVRWALLDGLPQVGHGIP